MKLPGIERHHIIYTFASLIAAYIVYLSYEYAKNYIFKFPESFNWYFIIGFIIYYFILIFFTKAFIFVGYAILASRVLGDNYKTNHPLEVGHLYLTSSSIITVFIVNEIFSVYPQLWILVLLLPSVFFITLFLNTKLRTNSAF